MKTSELIEQARYCRTIETPAFCGDCSCPYFDTKGNCGNELLKDLADRLEMAYDDLRFSPACATCKFFEGATTNDKSWVCEQCIINNQYRVPTNWQWRGDEEC